MIFPTSRAIFLMLLGVPVMIAVALLRPDLWVVSAGWIGGVAGLVLMDAMIGARLRAFEIEVEAPSILYVGGSDPVDAVFRFKEGPLPHRVETLLEVNDFLEPVPQAGLR